MSFYSAAIFAFALCGCDASKASPPESGTAPATSESVSPRAAQTQTKPETAAPKPETAAPKPETAAPKPEVIAAKPTVEPSNPGAIDALGFFTAADAPDPLACTSDQQCTGNTILEASGCCRDPRSLRAVAKAYDYWASARQQSVTCKSTTCPPPPHPSMPPECAIAPRCVAQRCVTQCPADLGITGAGFELRVHHVRSERSKDSSTVSVVALLVEDGLYWEQTHTGARGRPARVERRTLTPADLDAVRKVLADTKAATFTDAVAPAAVDTGPSATLSATVGLLADGTKTGFRLAGSLSEDGRATPFATSAAVGATERLLEVLRGIVDR